MNKTAIQVDYNQAKNVGYKLIAKGDVFGLFVLLSLETGIRANDLLQLDKSNFIRDQISNRHLINFTAAKTRKRATRPISKYAYDLAMQKETNAIFYNMKYGCKYSHTWASRKMKENFSEYINKAKSQGMNVSPHSLRKAAGAQIYKKYGIEGARDFLQHENYDTTKVYLKITETELNEKIIDAFDL